MDFAVPRLRSQFGRLANDLANCEGPARS
jgi:hypothetical protein